MKKWTLLLLLVAMAIAPAAARASTTWTVQKIDEHSPFFDPHPLAGASCTNSGFCAVVGVAGRIETTSNPTGGSTAWQPADLGTPGLIAIACPSASLCVAVNESTGDVTASTNPTGGASTWQTVATSSAGAMVGVSCFDSSHCVAVGVGGEVLRSATPATPGPGSWTAATIDGGSDLRAVSCPSATSCVALDSNNNAVTSNNLGAGTPTWAAAPIDPGGSASAISCPNTSLCVAVDSRGDAVTTTNPTAGTPVWTAPNDVDPNANEDMTGISCASDTQCVAVDNGGNAIFSSNPTAATPWSVHTAYNDVAATSLAGISCTTQPLCVAVDADGNALTATTPAAGTSAWTVTPVEGTTRLEQGSCPTTTLCVIPDRIGKVLTSSTPAGAADTWTAKDVDGTHQIFQVDCPSTSLCVGVDDAGNVLTSNNPSAPTPSWTVGSVAPSALYGLHGISCPSTSLCVAVGTDGSLVTSTNPAAGASSWSSPVTIDPHGNSGPFRINCPSTQLCVAVDESGNVVTSTDPTGGAGAWTVTKVDGTTPLYSISCHGTTLCVAGDSDGNVLSSTSPATHAWSAPVSFGAPRIFALACPATDFCIAADNAGVIYSTSDPTGGASAWSFLAATNDSFGALGATCATTTLCILSDYQSNIAVGALSPPAVTTGAASAVTGSSATANGTVNPNGSDVIDCHFDYGTTSSYGATTPCVETVGDGTAAVAVDADLTGLTPNTSYHVRLDASGDGGPGQGGDVSFTTAAVAPTVTVAPAANVSAHGALLTGDVNPNNANVTDCHFEYGTTTQYGTSVPCDQSPGGGVSAVPVSATLSGLALNTTYDFELVATNAGGTTRATGTFDTTAIDTTITSGPNGPTNNPVATFTFTADPAAGATFLCSVDHASPSPCTSPLTTASLPDGNHDITVRAVTPSGVQDATPAEHDFVVDTVAPRTAVAFAPAPGTASNQVGTGEAFSGPVQVTVSPTDPDPGSGIALTRCAVDPARAPTSFSALPSVCPKTVSGVGTHVIYAASQDAAGNLETPTAHAFKILAVPDTTITGGPNGPTWDSGPTFTFTSTIPGSTFRCRIDSVLALFTACSSPYTSSALGVGSHTIQVAAISPDGVGDPTPATRTFSVNPPESHSWECHIDPYTDLNPYSGDPGGCEFVTQPPCAQGEDVRCITIGTICPTGARCTLKGTTDFNNADQNAEWAIDASTAAVSPTGRIRLGGATGNCDGLEPSGPNCHRTGLLSILGENDALDFTCDAADFNFIHGTRYGSSADRSLACSESVSIEAAAPLSFTDIGLGLGVFVPAAGTLQLGGAGAGGHTVRASAASRATPVFRAIRTRVKRAGVVTVMLHLNGAGARTYRRRHRLTVRVRETFTPAHGPALVKLATVTLRAPTPTLSQQCKSTPRLRRTRTCRALTRRRRRT